MDKQHELTLAVWTREYVSWLETAITNEVCKCAWIDSGRLGPNGKPLRSLSHAHPLCQVHTKEGRIVGFLVWATEHKGLRYSLDPKSLVPLIDLTGIQGFPNDYEKVNPELQEKLASLPIGQLTLDAMFDGEAVDEVWKRTEGLPTEIDMSTDYGPSSDETERL